MNVLEPHAGTHAGAARGSLGVAGCTDLHHRPQEPGQPAQTPGKGMCFLGT